MVLGKRKRMFKSRTNKRRRKNVSIARRALTKVNKLSRRVEKKTSRTISTTSTVADPTNATLERVSNIALGDGRDQRDGNKITGMYGHIHGSVKFNSNATTPDNQWIRIAIFQDRFTNETSPPTVLDSVSATDLLEGSTYVSNFNLQTYPRYKLLKVINIQRDTQQSMDYEYYFKGTFKLPKDIKYNGNAGTDESKNAVWLAAWSNDAFNSPTLFRTVRIWYKDM